VARLITEAAGGVAGRVLRVLVVASGPLAEGFEFLGRWPGARVVFTCLDVDANAHAFVRLRAEERGVADRIVTHTCNVLKLAAGKESLDLPPQDLAYSIGLNDYLQEAHSIRLLNWMHRALAPGGTAVLGNLTKGTEAEFAASVLNWPLEYRTREDLERLFGASAFAASAAHWTDDATGCQLYHSASR
jgi:SAM-dependent methyltransferase